jgi:hypothetical protein
VETTKYEDVFEGIIQCVTRAAGKEFQILTDRFPNKGEDI